MQSGGCSSSSPPPFTFFRHDTPEVRTWIRAGTAPDDAALAGDLGHSSRATVRPRRSRPGGHDQQVRVEHHREPGLADLDLLEAGAPQASRQPQSRRDWTKWEPQAGARALDEVEFPVAAAPRAADESSARP